MISVSYLFENKTYDKVSWHFPEGKGNKNLKDATVHFQTLMNWLNKNNLLTSLGKEILQTKIGEDFAITSDMLIDDGNKLLNAHYSEWLKTFKYGTKPSTIFWDKKLKE